MSTATEEFKKVVDSSMPFPAEVISAYARLECFHKRRLKQRGQNLTFNSEILRQPDG